MKTDVREKDNTYELDVDLPGFKKDEPKKEEPKKKEPELEYEKPVEKVAVDSFLASLACQSLDTADAGCYAC